MIKKKKKILITGKIRKSHVFALKQLFFLLLKQPTLRIEPPPIISHFPACSLSQCHLTPSTLSLGMFHLKCFKNKAVEYAESLYHSELICTYIS